MMNRTLPIRRFIERVKAEGGLALALAVALVLFGYALSWVL